MKANPRLGKPAKPPEVGLAVEQLEMLSRLATVLGVATQPVHNQPEVSPNISASHAGVFVDALLDRTYRRVPQAANTKRGVEAEVCPYSGLSRAQFYELFNLEEDGQPAIESLSFKQEGEAHGARFYNVGSAVKYMKRLAEQQAREATG